MNRGWVASCVIAETVGMAASAGAARAATSLDTRMGFLVVLGGGLVEGFALGSLQGGVLQRLVGVSARGWLLVTLLVAGVGWAVGSAPSTLGGDASAGPTPALGLILLGALGIGVGVGAVFGAAQAAVLRTHVQHPWRWVAVSAAAWGVAMPVIFAGASTAGASWHWARVVLYGAGTGALAGTALGVVSGVALPEPRVRSRTIDGPLARPCRRHYRGSSVPRDTSATDDRTRNRT